MRLFSDCFYHFLKLRSVVLDSGGMVETPCTSRHPGSIQFLFFKGNLQNSFQYGSSREKVWVCHDWYILYQRGGSGCRDFRQDESIDSGQKVSQNILANFPSLFT